MRLLALALCLASCSTVSVTRSAKGSLHAGVTSFMGKQGLQNTTITTREGDTITLNGYRTQNPDPETTKLVRDGVLIKAGIEAAENLTQPTANAVGNVIAQ
jgi:hypothetical protein